MEIFRRKLREGKEGGRNEEGGTPEGKRKREKGKK